MTKRKTTTKLAPPTLPELQALVAQLGLDVPVYGTRVVGDRIELYCYGGLLVCVAPGGEAEITHLGPKGAA